MRRLVTLSFLMSLLVGTAVADTLRLKDGRVIEGTMVARDQNMVTFNVNGQDQWFPTEQVAGIDFGDAAPTAQAPAAQAPAAPAPAPQASAPAEVAAGTQLTVRLSDTLDTRKTGKGQRFTAVLEADLVASNGSVIAPRGSQVYGRVIEADSSGRLAGKPSIVLELTEVMVNNQMKPIVTGQLQASGDSAGRNTVGRTARGAVIGGLIDGGDGAKTGAKVGLGASVLFGKNHIEIPSGTLLDFRLRTPFFG
ncbi:MULTISPECIES: hypothetical protein [Corallincola]|uniref:Uncharacterized protein n=3 Tax=Corallincola TaxID=1775176 RepID=A0A368NRJ7_9GAMM|nr:MULTISPECIES: hypothetical protein [Corallincola]RCU51881.1 hypothetical protein DU002_05270 [Corallincola holothuriorum]TAA47371.1 hypothetical protein EXY25_09060 [Corallincola spongiicola]TCI05044.1 hypothetical protein EZV61_03510 [Corallincola luteus]